MAKNGFYAVANGRNVGVYTTWAECRAQVSGYPSARYKKFGTESEALAFIANYQLGCKPLVSNVFEMIKRNIMGAVCREIRRELRNVLRVPPQLAIAAYSCFKKSCRKRKTTESLPDLQQAPKRLEDCNSEIWKDAVVVYTDGACPNNGRGTAKAGYGIYWGPGHKDNTYGPVHGAPTNNRGELLAVDIALKQAVENKIPCIVVRTDSQLLIKSMDVYMEKWKKFFFPQFSCRDSGFVKTNICRNSWKTSSGGEVKNQDLLRSIDASTRKIHVRFIKHLFLHS
uniref:Ribonuclease H1 n=1 Tax=Angiostrongylus cantonensis TaxID=6313 RepID=A0A0K0DID0_ANGCA